MARYYYRLLAGGISTRDEMYGGLIIACMTYNDIGQTNEVLMLDRIVGWWAAMGGFVQSQMNMHDAEQWVADFGDKISRDVAVFLAQKAGHSFLKAELYED